MFHVERILARKNHSIDLFFACANSFWLRIIALAVMPDVDLLRHPLQEALMRALTVANATWREAIRQPVCIIVLCVAAAVTFLSQFLNFYHFDDETSYNVIRQMAVAQTLICGMVIAVFTASAVLADEIESRTVMTLLAKPIRRGEVVIGKFLGIMMTVAAAFGVMILISLCTIFWAEARVEKWRTNPALMVGQAPWLLTGQGTLATASATRELVTKRRGHGMDYMRTAGELLLLVTGQTTRLASHAPGAAPGKAPDNSGLHRYHDEVRPGLASLIREALAFLPAPSTTIVLQAFLLTLMQVMVMAALAIAVATRLPLVFNALFCATIFVLGNIWPHLADALFGTDLHLLPNFQNFDLTEALSVGINRVGSGVWIYGVLYGISYTVLVLAVAVLLFRRREVA
jgi:hypothetical protein